MTQVITDEQVASTPETKIQALKTYVGIQVLLAVLAFLFAPLATGMVWAYYSLTGNQFLAVQSGDDFLQMIILSFLIMPFALLLFNLAFSGPYILSLKKKNNSNAWHWIGGLSLLSLIFPAYIHVLKFCFEGLLQIHLMELSVLTIYMTLYCTYGVNTLTAVFIAFGVYLLQRVKR